MHQPDMTYLQNNRHIAERLLVFLEDRRLLRDRMSDEDQVYCRKSADALRKVLENEMLNVQHGGFLLDALRELRRACTNFVSAAGPKSQAFKEDNALFQYHLEILREAFAQRVRRIVTEFDLRPTPEVQEIMDFGR
jgi:hypothetical protein